MDMNAIGSGTQKAVVILSGGLDSTTLLYDVVQDYGRENVYALSFNYNQKHKHELSCAIKTCERLGVNHQILNLDILNQIAPSALTRDDWKVPEGHYADENMKQTVVSNRNMIMLSLAGAFAMSKKITNLYYGAHSGDHDIYPDCRFEFIEAMQKVLLLADWSPLHLHAPYWAMNKISILTKGLKLGVDYSMTHTCYNPNEKGQSCNRCGSCCERQEAFKLNNMTDPLEYYN